MGLSLFDGAPSASSTISVPKTQPVGAEPDGYNVFGDVFGENCPVNKTNFFGAPPTSYYYGNPEQNVISKSYDPNKSVEGFEDFQEELSKEKAKKKATKVKNLIMIHLQLR